MRKKLRLAFIEDATSRRATFHKRKKGLMKKLNELVTLCDIKACAVVYSPYDWNPEPWPSREGVGEVVSRFMDLSVQDRTKKMVDQKAFMRQRISKEEDHLKKLRNDNRDSQIRDFMFKCLKGEIDVCHYGEKGLQDLSSYIDKYLNDLNRRIKILNNHGESSSSLPPPTIQDVTAPIGYYDHMIQYQNQNQNQSQHQGHYDFYDQILHEIHDFNTNINLNQTMSLDLNQSLNVVEDEGIPSLDGSHHQSKSACHASTTGGAATPTADACGDNITNKF